jgi:ectoine hydroxylase-related dioxygenase (phytanoyl-CoA dioxygenase family)
MQEILSLLAELGIANPVMNTRPLVSYSSKKLAKNNNYWKIPAHQDWPSTQGSLNGLTVWIPLINITNELGPLEVVPGSHLLGKLEHIEIEGVPVLSQNNWNFLPIPMDVGDVLVFSNFLIHRSGTNLTENKIRWSVHFRYDDANESTFIERNFPHHRTDKRLPGLLHPDFPTKEVLENFFSLQKDKWTS